MSQVDNKGTEEVLSNIAESANKYLVSPKESPKASTTDEPRIQFGIPQVLKTEFDTYFKNLERAAGLGYRKVLVVALKDVSTALKLLRSGKGTQEEITLAVKILDKYIGTSVKE